MRVPLCTSVRRAALQAHEWKARMRSQLTLCAGVVSDGTVAKIKMFMNAGVKITDCATYVVFVAFIASYL